LSKTLTTKNKKFKKYDENVGMSGSKTPYKRG
jgi:hypothetical protein